VASPRPLPAPVIRVTVGSGAVSFMTSPVI
jgi:hypothetical protein